MPVGIMKGNICLTELDRVMLRETFHPNNTKRATMNTPATEVFRTRLYAMILPAALAALAWLAQLNYSGLTEQNRRIESQQSKILDEIHSMHDRILRVEFMIYNERPEPPPTGDIHRKKPFGKSSDVYSQN
jgi:hypothetical protein